MKLLELKPSGLMIAQGSVALAAVGLMLMPGVALAKPASGSYRIEMKMPASHGYRIDVSGRKPGPRKLIGPNVEVTATKGRRYTVLYAVHGTATDKGILRAALPGVGRIAVRFQAQKVTRTPIPDNCTGRPNVVTRGVFRGVIELTGEQGYTSVHRSSAPGKLTESFRTACDEHESEGGKRQPRVRQATLLVGREGDGRSIGFDAIRVDFGLASGPLADYSASSTTLRNGLLVWTEATAEDDSTGFSTPDPPGLLEDATVEPPAPFTGSATFHLDSPHSSTWTGTLAVELPGLGVVSLSEPQFWSALCEEETCTKTLPRNASVGFFSGSF